MTGWPRMTRAQAAVYVVALLFVAFEVVRSVLRAQLVVFSGYTELGEGVLQGADPYGPRFAGWPALNTWPPFFGFVAAGLALLSRVSLHGALALWQVASVLALWGTIRLLARMFEVGGDRLTFWPVAPGQLAFASGAVIVPVLLSTRILQEHLQHAQVNLFVLFLVLLGFHLFRTQREALGGLSLALAASVKAVPVVFLLYLVYKRAWRAAAWTTAALVLLNVALPAAAFGPREAAAQWRKWSAVSSREMSDPTSHHSNQSLLAGLKRLLTREGGTPDPIHYAIADWPMERVRNVFAAAALLAALGLANAFRRHPPGLAGPRAAAEIAICLPAATLVTPLAWKAHFVTLLPCYWCVWWMLRQLPADSAGRRWGMRWLAASGALVTLSAPAIVGSRASAILESFDVITIGALIAVGVGVWLLRLLPPPPPANSAAPIRP